MRLSIEELKAKYPAAWKAGNSEYIAAAERAELFQAELRAVLIGDCGWTEQEADNHIEHLYNKLRGSI